MATVTFALEFKSSELRTLDLPIEVRKPDSTIVVRTLASKPVEVPPGHYYATARLPGGQKLLQRFEMTAQPQTVTLAPDAEDESPHEWEETSHYLQPPRSIWRAKPETDRRAGARESLKSPAGDDPAQAAPVAAKFRLFAGNPISGDIHLEPAMSHLTIGHFERGRIVQFVVRGSDVPLIAQLIEPAGPVHNLTIPAAPFTTALLVFTRREDGTCRMDVHLRNNTADMLLESCATAALDDAGETSRSHLLDAERLLEEKGSDPVAAAVAACSILRFGQLQWLHEWTANLDARFPWLPDGAAIRGEHLARNGKHVEAAARLFEVSGRGLPLISDALFYAVERLKWYASLRPQHAAGIDVARAGIEVQKLLPFAVTVHRQRPVTSYPGLDPAHPDAEVAEVGVSFDQSIDLSEWLSDGGTAELRGGSRAESNSPQAAPALAGRS